MRKHQSVERHPFYRDRGQTLRPHKVNIRAQEGQALQPSWSTRRLAAAIILAIHLVPKRMPSPVGTIEPCGTIQHSRDKSQDEAADTGPAFAQARIRRSGVPARGSELGRNQPRTDQAGALRRGMAGASRDNPHRRRRRHHARVVRDHCRHSGMADGAASILRSNCLGPPRRASC